MCVNSAGFHADHANGICSAEEIGLGIQATKCEGRGGKVGTEKVFRYLQF